MKSILFVSCVHTWGGSEILWTETAAALSAKDYNITFAIRYNNPVIEKLRRKGASYINIDRAEYPPILHCLLRKLKLKRHPFLQALITKKPQLVVINLINNVHGRYYLTSCKRHGIPYVTITHLVPDFLWALNDDEVIDEIRNGYGSAELNYFASRANVDQHNIMIGDEHPNSRIILNPFTVPVEVPDQYPSIINGQYCIALVGRLETFHKGQDLLLQVLRYDKWKDRPITFNIYGTGPYRRLLERLVKKYDIKNVVFKGHVYNVSNIWKTNHLLILPSRMEGQALALIEAMWCYRGAIVTNVGGARELITDAETGFMADYPTVSHIDSALEKAWSLRDQWEKIGRNAGRKIREIYKEHPIVSFTQEIERVFNKISVK